MYLLGTKTSCICRYMYVIIKLSLNTKNGVFQNSKQNSVFKYKGKFQQRLFTCLYPDVLFIFRIIRYVEYYIKIMRFLIDNISTISRTSLLIFILRLSVTGALKEISEIHCRTFENACVIPSTVSDKNRSLYKGTTFHW